MHFARLKLTSVPPVARLANYIEQTELKIPKLADEYRYASLPLCVVDAVFSIGVRYTSTQKVVSNLCEYAGWTRFFASREARGAGEYGIGDLNSMFDKFGAEGMAESVFQNRQRTSSRSWPTTSKAAFLDDHAEHAIHTGLPMPPNRSEKVKHYANTSKLDP